MKNKNKISDISFIGSGISTSFTILNFLNHLDQDSTLSKKLSINIIDKYSEFNTGIPYGNRSGFTTLLITSLRNFLPEPELSKFISWLNSNKEWLLKEFENEGGELSKKWLIEHASDIENNKWEELFIPRRFFGCYIDLKVKDSIEKLERQNKVIINYINGKVVNLTKNNNLYKISLENGDVLQSEKIILSVGSLPVNNLWKDKKSIKKKDILFVNTPYSPELKNTFNKVNKFLNQRKDKVNNVLIIGANASGLELLYKLNDIYPSSSNVLNNFVFLSTQGRAPDSVIDEVRKKEFVPVNLLNLKKENSLNADLIAEAAFKDISVSDGINLGAASTVDVISSAFGNLLEKLNKIELEKFACHYGNAIGKKQRCAGVHYSNTIEDLKKENVFEHLAGRFSNLVKKGDSYYLNYTDTKTGKEETYSSPFNLVFNCIGGKNLKQPDVPEIIKNVISKDFCKPNESNIGFHVNDNLEASSNLHIMGPLLAGNVIENKAVWHVEHCGRIIWLSEVLSDKLYDYFVKKESKQAFLANIPIENSSFKVITEKKEWHDFLKRMDNYDFYHTYDYHKLSLINHETAALLSYTQDDVAIGLPLIIRNIEGTHYKDATSVYGYAGPISKGIASDFNNSSYITSLTQYFDENNIISVFSRLNPYINSQHEVLNNFGEIVSQGKIVNIDLGLTLIDQRRNYRSRLKTHLNKARRHCKVEITNTNEGLKKFIELYHENMDRVNAKEFYYFNVSYFKNLMESDEFCTTILSVINNTTGETIGACMFISANSILHYHLSGTKKEFLHLTPTKLLIDEMRLIATEKGCSFFNLGGGLGGRDDDSLYHFKSSFSKDYKYFNLWQYIVNEDVYLQLSKKNKTKISSNYFPNYRSNEVCQ